MSARTGQIDFIEFPGADAATLQKVKAFYGKAFDWEFQDWGDNYVDTASSGLGAGFNADGAQAPSQPLAVIFAVDLGGAFTFTTRREMSWRCGRPSKRGAIRSLAPFARGVCTPGAASDRYLCLMCL